MSVTINDVANEAGVSKSTVSKVLNHWTTISPATVEKVHAAIEKLHYTPNSRAVSFAKGATSNIVYLTNLEKDTAYRNPHMFDIMCGVHHTLSENNYSLTLINTSEEHYPEKKSVKLSQAVPPMVLSSTVLPLIKKLQILFWMQAFHTLSLGIRVLKAAYAG